MSKGKKGRGKKRKFELSKRGIERIELLADFLIKFNFLAIPMYIILFSRIEFYPLQLFLADVVHKIITAFGYEAVRNWTALKLITKSSVIDVVISLDCTAWKSMYALAALMIASPVANGKRKLKHIVLGISAIFLINILRLVITILVGYNFGMYYLDVVHTLLWREGMIFAVIVIWLIWIKNEKEKQKVIFRKEQTILRRVFNLSVE